MTAMSRRSFLGGLALAGWGAAACRPLPVRAQPGIHTGTIPATGEAIPAIGMGTWITFNVGEDPAMRARRVAILRAFFTHGGGMIDSSPMYGSSEAVVGHCLRELGYPEGLFSATKVWHWLQGAGEEQMAESRGLWGVERFDLMQVHNLRGWEGHMETLKADRAAGRIRYLGVTTSHGRRHAELERIMETQPLDFVQVTYNILDREAEQRLLPLAAERGIAVIANRPFRRKALIRRFEGQPLPDWAGEAGAATWPQFLLKFIVSHPDVTCAIPATSRVDHMRENMAALRGPVPDADLRRRMARYAESL
jgi:diketogulonate reductase-like aldo/keto reductase